MSDLETQGREAGVYFTASDLMARTFPEPRWAVRGLIAEGLNLLVGAPKLGKSWLCLALAVAVALGGRALGRIPVEAGDVLYAALEDTPRRLQNRLHAVLGDAPTPARLHFVTALPKMPDAIHFIAGWLEDHPDARLVIVDVLRKVRPPSDGRNAYAEDYDVMSALKSLADRYGVAILAVHHTRKAADESDVFNEVSGSTGLTGAADAILIAKRSRNTALAELHVTGRDVTEAEYGLEWHPDTCSWSLTEEPVAVMTLGDTRRRVLDYLATAPAATPSDIAKALALNINTAKSTLRRMTDDQQLDSDGRGAYFLPLHPATAATAATDRVHGLHGLHVVEGGGP